MGKRGKNNGILLLVAMQSHDIWIEVGSGLAEELEDDKVQQIVDGVIIPKFRAGQPDQGIIQGVRSIVLYLDNAGTYVQINYEGTPYSEIGSLSPDLGKKFLVVDLTIENHGYNGVDTNPYHFKVTVDNVEYGYAAWETEYLEVINKATLDSVTLKDGGKISGSLAFQVPATVTTYSFAYVPHPFENFNVKYNIL